MLGRKLAVATVLVSGVAITALELAAARLLAPFFGSTIFVWGSAIGTVLAALALGYWLGGKIADRRPSRAVLSFIITFAGLSAALIPLTYRGVGLGINSFGESWGIPVGVLALITMVVLFTWPIVALGAVSPFVLRLSLKGVDESGSWSGLLSGLSTLGSIAGTFFAAFFSIPVIGTRQTIVLSAGILVLLGVTLGSYPRKFRVLPVAFFIFLGSMGSTGPFLQRAGLVWEHESPYQLIQVVKQRDRLNLITDAGKGVQSVYLPGTPFTDTIYDSFGLLPFLVERDGRQRSVLVIGLGGGTMIRLFEKALSDRFDFTVTGVEIDPGIIDAARSHFNLDDLTIKVVIDDARRYLRETSERFDLIIVDAYVHELQIPPFLATREFFDDVRRHVAPGGIVGMNILVTNGTQFFDKFLQTVSAVFPDVRTAPFVSGAANRIVLAAEAINLERLPISIHPKLDRYLKEIVPNLERVRRNEQPVYTDERTDIELRLQVRRD